MMECAVRGEASCLPTCKRRCCRYRCRCRCGCGCRCRCRRHWPCAMRDTREAQAALPIPQRAIGNAQGHSASWRRTG
ncbi:hypothetical protein DYQ94_20020 [Xanthomonas sp. LMG 8993]|nr:hypothetical protein [Xanthomonas sp. LMG 8993]